MWQTREPQKYIQSPSLSKIEEGNNGKSHRSRERVYKCYHLDMLSSGCKHTHFLWDRHQIYFQCKFYNRQEGSNTPNCHFLLVCKSHCQNCIHDCRLLGQDYYLVDHFWNYKIKFHNVSGTCDCLYGDDDGIAWLMVIVIRKMAMY